MRLITGRFGSAEVLFDRICAENEIRHLLTAPRSPTTTGKVERWHKTIPAECYFPSQISGFPNESCDLKISISVPPSGMDYLGHVLENCMIPSSEGVGLRDLLRLLGCRPDLQLWPVPLEAEFEHVLFVHSSPDGSQYCGVNTN